MYDVYGSYVTYRVLRLFRDNDIIVDSLPAHTSHALHPLDIVVFGSMKNEFPNLLSKRSVPQTNNTKNDLYTLCELIRKAYFESMMPLNIIAEFSRAKLWCDETRGPNQNKIRSLLYTAETEIVELQSLSPTTRSRARMIEEADEPISRATTAKQLYAPFLSNVQMIEPDVLIRKNREVKVSPSIGGTPTSDNVIKAAREVMKRKEREAAAKAERVAVRERLRIQKAAQEAQKLAESDRKE